MKGSWEEIFIRFDSFSKQVEVSMWCWCCNKQVDLLDQNMPFQILESAGTDSIQDLAERIESESRHSPQLESSRRGVINTILERFPVRPSAMQIKTRANTINQF